MSTISFCSSKGGCAKSTTCILTSLEAARAGKRVLILDSDPKKWLSGWSDIKEIPENITVQHVEREEITEQALYAADEYDVVLIDVEGSDDASIIDAILVSDLVVIPGQASLPDVKAAVQVLKRVRSRSKILGRDIEARVLLTFTEPGPIEANISKDMRQVLVENNAPLMRAQLAHRPIFKSMVSAGGDYVDLPARYQGSNLDSAVENVEAITNEIFTLLRERADKKGVQL